MRRSLGGIPERLDREVMSSASPERVIRSDPDLRSSRSEQTGETAPRSADPRRDTRCSHSHTSSSARQASHNYY